MRRFVSILMILALSCATVSRAAGDDARGAPRLQTKRNAKGILLWGGLFLANSALLTLGIRDRADFDDAAAEAEARGEDAGAYREGYDRAGWIVVGSGVAALVSGVGLLHALRARPAGFVAAEPRLAATSPHAEDPVARAIEDIEARRALGAPAPAPATTAAGSESATPPKKPPANGRPAPIVLSRIRTQQAWLPGTVIASPDSSVADTATSSAEARPPTTEASRPSVSSGASSSGQPPTRYAVQVASYRRLSDAQSDSARWAERGYPAVVVEKDLGERGVWYRVVLGDFARSVEAESLADWLRGTFPRQDARVTRR